MSVKQVVTHLVESLATSPSFAAAQHHYKLEEWAAVEAFSFFKLRRRDWYPSAGSLPYVTARHKGEEKWCDVYARHVVNDATLLHLWVEFKAVPLTAGSPGRTVAAFCRDIRAPADMDRQKTIMFWQTGRNPRTGVSQSAWFRKFDGPGSIREGAFAGLAVLFVGAKVQADLDHICSKVEHLTTGTHPELVAQRFSLCDSAEHYAGLGCLAYWVPIDKLPSPLGDVGA